MNSALHGFWTVQSHLIAQEREVLHIDETRFVHFMHIDRDNPANTVAIGQWCEHQGGDVFIMRLDPKEDGRTFLMRIDHSDLIIHNGSHDFRCRRMDASDIPDSYHSNLGEAYLKMDSIASKKK